MSSRNTLRFLLVTAAAFGLARLELSRDAAYAGPPPSEVDSLSQIAGTESDKTLRAFYSLDSGANAIIVSSMDTGQVTSTIPMNSMSGKATSMGRNTSNGNLVVGSDQGEIFEVDPTTQAVSSLMNDNTKDVNGVLADTYAPSVDVYYYDKKGNAVYQKGPAINSVVSYAPGVPDKMSGMAEKTTSTGSTAATIVALQKGSAIVWTYNRDTLVDADVTYSGVTPSGAAYAGGDDYFVTVNNAGQGELLRVNLDPTAFGFVFPPEKTWSDSAFGVAFDNGIVAVVTGSSSPTQGYLDIFDFGDSTSLFEVGRLEISTDLPAPDAVSIAADGPTVTTDDISYIAASAGEDARTGSTSTQQDDLAHAQAGTIGGDGWGAETGGANADHSPHYCSDCDEETQAEGHKVNAATNGRVDFATGEEVHVRPLFSVPGIGMDLDMVLTYRSQRDHDYSYGKGWYLNHDARMRTAANGDEEYRSPFGRHETYVKSGATYLTPHNFDTTLTVNAGVRTVTNRFGTTTVYNAAGYRTSTTDRYGNAITYAWSNDQLTTITDTRNQTYTLAYGTDGRMSSITDYGGRTWTFAYDYRGRLIKITTPGTPQHPNGRDHRYSYSRNHVDATLADNLVYIWSPKGDIVQELEYDPDNDWVTKETVGPGSWTMSYDLPNSKTTAVDPSGNTTIWTFDSAGYVVQKEQLTKGLRSGEPTSYVTSYELGASSNMIEAVVYPRGNRVESVYDSQLNLLQITRKETNTTSSSSSDIVVTRQFGLYSQMTQSTDPRGNVTTYTIDPSGNTTAISRPTVTSPASQTITETFTYDTAGRVTSATDGAGRKTDFTYYASGTQAGWLATIVRDPASLALTTTFAYDQFGNVTSVTDPRGNATTFTVDEESFITQIQAPSPFNYQTKFFYDQNGDLERKEVENRDRKGVLDPTTPWITTDYAYNEVSWRTSKTAPLTASVSAVTTYEYQGAGLVSKITNAEGEATELLYDERDLLFKVTRGFGTSDATTTRFDYDLNGNLSTTTNGRSFTTTRTYDLFDRRERVTDPLGHYVSYAYDKSSNVTSVQAFDAGDVLQAARTNHFDEIDRLWKVERSRFGPGLTTTTPTTTFKRDAGHRLLETTDPLNRRTTRTYDAVGRLLSVKDAASNEVKYTYDANGNATLVERMDVPATGPSETFKTEYDFDALNRAEERREIDRLNASNILTTTFEYDSRGNLTFRVDAEGNPVRWGYDLASRMTDYERALAVGATIDVFTDSIHETMDYDKVHRLVTVTDDNFNATSYEYDEVGRAKKTTFADSKFVSRSFDDNGNVLSWTDQNGSVVSNTYDSNDRLITRAITRGTGVQGPTSESYVYDPLDRLVHAQDDDYQFTRAFDSVGNLLSDEQGYLTVGQEKWKKVSTGWSEAGSSINVTYPSGRKFSHNRDAIDRLTSIVETVPQTTVATHTWQGIGRMATTTHQNNTTTEYSYDGFARVSTIEHFTASVQTFHKFDYAYDKVHNRRMEQNSFTAAWVNGLPTAIKTFLAARNGKGDVYAYDKAYRMVDARYDATNPLTEVGSPGTQTYATKTDYTLDGLGNRSQVQSTPWGGSPTTTTYASDVVNQYTSLGGVTRTHDSNGNLTDDGTQLYVYDYKNRLVEVKLKSSGATIATYRYDALGRRVEKDVGGTVTRYVLDGVTVVEEYDGADAWQASYVHGDRIDHPCAMDRADVADVDGDGNTTEVMRFHYAQNALGSVSEMTDPAGAVVEWVTYDIYGASTVRDQNGAIVASSAVGSPFLFTGREWDVESGKYFYRARTYDPVGGRFVQRDPKGPVDGLALYEYVRSAPVARVDPLGWRSVTLKDVEEAELDAGIAQSKVDDLTEKREELKTREWVAWKRRTERELSEEEADIVARDRRPNPILGGGTGELPPESDPGATPEQLKDREEELGREGEELERKIEEAMKERDKKKGEWKRKVEEYNLGLWRLRNRRSPGSRPGLAGSGSAVLPYLPLPDGSPWKPPSGGPLPLLPNPIPGMFPPVIPNPFFPWGDLFSFRPRQPAAAGWASEFHAHYTRNARWHNRVCI